MVRILTFPVNKGQVSSEFRDPNLYTYFNAYLLGLCKLCEYSSGTFCHTYPVRCEEVIFNLYRGFKEMYD